MARRETFVNAAITELASSLTDVATTATVVDGSTFPLTGDYRIVIGEELLMVTSRTGDVLTVERGLESTTAVAHNAGDQVNAILTRGAIEDYTKQNTWHGNSSPPLQNYILATGAPAIASDFTWVNQGTASATDRGGRVVLQTPPDAGDQIRGLFQAAPSAPYEIILACHGSGESSGNGQIGLAFRESGTGKIMTLANFLTNDIEVAKYTSPTAFSALLGTKKPWDVGQSVTWLKIADDNTNLKFYVGPNGQDWIEVGSEGRTVFMAGGPNEVGFHTNPDGSNTYDILMEIFHFGSV